MDVNNLVSVNINCICISNTEESVIRKYIFHGYESFRFSCDDSGPVTAAVKTCWASV